jgi:hypothetical protein
MEIPMKLLSLTVLTAVVLMAAQSADARTPSPWKTYTKEQKAAKSKECSVLADQQKLRGKKRRSFRNKCKHGQI